MNVRCVHLLLFACPECGLPVAETRVAVEKNLEKVDGHTFPAHCSYCEKTFMANPLDAVRHYVEEWGR
jgi:aspartate carbamoyltransferase regulatory subunit